MRQVPGSTQAFTRFKHLLTMFVLWVLALPALAQTPNYSDIWYTPGEEGWGLQIAHSGTTLFATWYTYDANNRQTFLTVTNGNFTNATTWSGQIFKPTGSPFNSATYDPSRFAAGSALGTATLTFANANSASLTYTVNGITRTKNLVRFPFNNATSGSYPADATDIYFLASQAGWGLSIAQRGSTGYFGVIYHYDTDGQPLFFTLTGTSGQLFRTTSTGANFLSATFNPSTIAAQAVGTFNLAIGASGVTLSWTINGQTVTNSLARLLPTPTTPPPTGSGNAGECVNEALWQTGATYRTVYVTAGQRSTSRGSIVGPQTCQSGAAGIRVDATTDSTQQGLSTTASTRTCISREGTLRILTSDSTTDTVITGLPVAVPPQTITAVFTPPALRRFDLNAGESYSQTYTARTSGTAGSAANTTSFTRTFVGIETVTVPAGTFRACRFDETSTTAGATARSSEWIASIGLSVRSLDRVNGAETVLESATVNGRNYP
jgi:hypothetical protein